jgi:hypothetical protein
VGPGNDGRTVRWGTRATPGEGTRHSYPRHPTPTRRSPSGSGLALVGVESLLERAGRLREAVQVPAALDGARGAPSILQEQGVERGLALIVPEHAEEVVHEIEPPRRRLGDLDREAAPRGRVQPPPETGRGGPVHPADPRQPVTPACEGADRIPAQRRCIRSGRAPCSLDGARLRDDVLQHGEEVLAQAERAAEEVGAAAAALDGLHAPQQGSVGARGRALPSRRVEAKGSPATRPGNDLQPVGLAEGEAAEQRLERLAPHGPVRSRRDGQDVPDDQLRGNGSRLPMRPREQHPIRLGLGRGGREGHERSRLIHVPLSGGPRFALRDGPLTGAGAWRRYWAGTAAASRAAANREDAAVESLP